jgi:hypothetical protein
MDLDGVRAKLDRADKHVQELHSLIAPITATATASIVREEDGDPTKLRYRVMNVPAVPTEVGAIVGDVLCNLRSALDHLAWQLVLRENREPTINTSFPIHIKPVGAVTIKPGITDTAIAQRLHDVQPFVRAAKYDRDPLDEALALVQKLNNFDKHKLLIASVCSINREEPGWWGAPKDAPQPEVRWRLSPINSGDVVVMFDFNGEQPWDDFEPNLALATSIWHREARWLTLIDVSEGMGTLCENVRQMISWEFLPLVGEPPIERSTSRLR